METVVIINIARIICIIIIISHDILVSAINQLIFFLFIIIFILIVISLDQFDQIKDSAIVSLLMLLVTQKDKVRDDI